jgi:hypothetical protein
MSEEKEQTLKEKIDDLNEYIKNDKKFKKFKEKKLKFPRKAKVSKSRMKKGWLGILFLNENRVVQGQKVKTDGGTYRTKDGGIHVSDGNELMFWESKHPFVFQRYDKLNPTNLFRKEGEKNEMYGQELVELRMKRDIIKPKGSSKNGIIIIIVVIIAGYFIIKTFFPKLFGG